MLKYAMLLDLNEHFLKLKIFIFSYLFTAKLKRRLSDAFKNCSLKNLF